jgi:hypothetical protein
LRIARRFCELQGKKKKKTGKLEADTGENFGNPEDREHPLLDPATE